MPVTRHDLYQEANAFGRLARVEERDILLRLLDVQPNDIVLDAPAWSGFLAEGISDPSRVICVEPSPVFADAIRAALPAATVHTAQIEKMPLGERSVDRVGSLVGLHHLTSKEAFVEEIGRVLRPGGCVVLSEVADGSDVARFLNGPVHRYTYTGHRGTFVRPGELSDLLWQSAGCSDVSEQHYTLHWRFASENAMLGFCRGLLGMARASVDELRACLYGYFDVQTIDGEICLPWALTYAVGHRSA